MCFRMKNGELSYSKGKGKTTVWLMVAAGRRRARGERTATRGGHRFPTRVWQRRDARGNQMAVLNTPLVPGCITSRD